MTARKPLPGHVPAIGSYRRVRGLVTIGWPFQRIADIARLDVQLVNDIAEGRAWCVTPEQAAGIRRATTLLGDRPGKSAQARQWAMERRYLSLYAWDDIDDPSARPTGVPRQHLQLAAVGLDHTARARFAAYQQPERGGCVRWVGTFDSTGRAEMAITTRPGNRTTINPRRIAFYLRTGRDAVGEVTPQCGNVWCVAGPCMVDESEQKAAA